MIFKCDSKIVADTLLGHCTLRVVVSNILVGVAHKIQDFQSICMSHVKRQGNKSAHILAKYAIAVENNDNIVTWIKENPPLIELAITHDIMNLSFF